MKGSDYALIAGVCILGYILYRRSATGQAAEIAAEQARAAQAARIQAANTMAAIGIAVVEAI